MRRLVPAVITGVLGCFLIAILIKALELGSEATSLVAGVLLLGLVAIIMAFALPPDLSDMAPNRINKRI